MYKIDEPWLTVEVIIDEHLTALCFQLQDWLYPCIRENVYPELDLNSEQRQFWIGSLVEWPAHSRCSISI